jgi:hypothetical protein
MEMETELEGSVFLQALDHMHANEVILTFGHSNTTHLFLKEAAKKRNFQVSPHPPPPHTPAPTPPLPFARGISVFPVLAGGSSSEDISEVYGFNGLLEEGAGCGRRLEGPVIFIA